MTQQDDLFTPEEVDEQIDRLSQSLEERALRQDDAPALHLMRDMRRLYQVGSQDDVHSLERAWGRIARQSRYALREGDEHEPSIGVVDQHERWRHRMQQNTPVSSRRQTAQRRIGMIAAVVFLAILVGSLIVVLNSARRGTTTGHSGNNPPSAGVLATPSPAVPPTPDANIGKVVYTRHEQQSNDVYQLAWSPDSTRLADANDMNFESWDATTGKHDVTYTGSGNFGGYAVGWSPDGKRVAGSSSSVYIWDASSGKLLLTYPKQSSGPTPTPTPLPGTPTPTPTPVPPVTPTPSPIANSVAGMSADAEFLSPNQQKIPGSGGNVVLETAWSPDGTLMASAFSGAGPGYGNVVYVWNTTTGKTVYTYHGHTDYITALAWSPDGKYIASCDASGTVQVWNATTGHLLAKLPVNATSLAWSPDGTRIVTGSSNVEVWNAMTGKLLLTHPGFSGGVTSVAWSPDGTRIASAGTHIEIWNAQTGKTIYTFTRNPNEERTIAWSPNGKYIASATGPGESGPVEIQVWIAS